MLIVLNQLTISHNTFTIHNRIRVRSHYNGNDNDNDIKNETKTCMRSNFEQFIVWSGKKMHEKNPIVLATTTRSSFQAEKHVWKKNCSSFLWAQIQRHTLPFVIFTVHDFFRFEFRASHRHVQIIEVKNGATMITRYNRPKTNASTSLFCFFSLSLFLLFRSHLDPTSYFATSNSAVADTTKASAKATRELAALISPPACLLGTAFVVNKIKVTRKLFD